MKKGTSINLKNSGHYVSFCKNNLDNKWYEFDDDSVKTVEPQDVVTESGYLLFYQKRSAKIVPGRHWCLRMPQVQKALDDARNGTNEVAEKTEYEVF